MSRKSRILPIDKLPFKSRSGAIIQPGDKILVLTTSRSWSNLGRGIYLGSRNNGRNAVVCEFSEATKLVHKDTREDYDRSKEPAYPDYPSYALYPYGSSIRVEAEKAYQVKVTDREMIIRALKADYVETRYIRSTITQLILNRIWPADWAT